MAHSSESTVPPLQEVVLAWAAAVNAVEHASIMIIRGGPVDRPRMAALLAAVETARLRCEQTAAGVLSGAEAGAI